jgi:hypothetical protein
MGGMGGMGAGAGGMIADHPLLPMPMNMAAAAAAVAAAAAANSHNPFHNTAGSPFLASQQSAGMHHQSMQQHQQQQQQGQGHQQQGHHHYSPAVQAAVAQSVTGYPIQSMDTRPAVVQVANFPEQVKIACEFN